MFENYDGAMKVWSGLTAGRVCSDNQIKGTIDDFTPAFVVDINIVLRHRRLLLHGDDV